MESVPLGPVALEGSVVRLEPLRREHSLDLFMATKGVDWSWFLGQLRTEQAVRARIAEGMEAESRGESYAFAVRMRDGAKVIGSTSYLSISQRHRRAEIGSTWYHPDYQGTSVNPECKFLLLRHAFEDWGAVRVQLVTDANNVRSQRAIEKLGAKPEGRMRNYGIRIDGTPREVLLYSIIPPEWATIKEKLLARIQSFPDATKSQRVQPSTDVHGPSTESQSK